MKLRVHVNYRQPGTAHATKVGESIIQCGEGTQVLRWLAYTACTRLAYLRGEPATAYVPQAVTYPDGTLLDVDTVMSELFRDEDDVFVEYSTGPVAFSARWDGRPVTPPFRWDGAHVVGIPDDDWLRKFDLKLMGFGDTLVAQAPQLAASPQAVEDDLAAAKQYLIDQAGFLQALFVHTVSLTLETQGDQGEKDFAVAKSLEEMSLVPYKRIMVEAQLATDVFPFSKLIDIFHMTKTIETVKKVSSTKKPLLTPQVVGFVDPKATISFKEFLLAVVLIAQYKLAVGLEHAGWGSVRLTEKLEKLMQHFFIANNGPNLINLLTNSAAEFNMLRSPNVGVVLAAQRKHIEHTLDLCQFKRTTGDERRVDMKHLMAHLRKLAVLNETDVTHHDLAKSHRIDVATLGQAFLFAAHPTEPNCEVWRLRKVPLMVNCEEFELMLLVIAHRVYVKHKELGLSVDAAFELFLLRFLEDIFLKMGVIKVGTYSAAAIPEPEPEAEVEEAPPPPPEPAHDDDDEDGDS